jgi:AraC-like DNA-binding protein
MELRLGSTEQRVIPDRILPPDGSSRSLSSVAWVLEMFTDGQMELAIEQGSFQAVGRAWGALYSPGTHYRERLEPGQRCQSVVVYFDPGMGDVLKRLKNLQPGHRFIHDPQGQLREMAQRIETKLFGQDADQLEAMGAFLQAMSLLVACADDGRTLSAALTAGDDLVDLARAYMRDHLHENISVADMASHCRMSESGFAHAYRRQAGYSPMLDLRRIRVEAVKMQLLHNRLTLAQIAQVTGFSDGFHLSHVFRKVAGVSPRQFKQRASAAMNVLS